VCSAVVRNLNWGRGSSHFLLFSLFPLFSSFFSAFFTPPLPSPVFSFSFSLSSLKSRTNKREILDPHPSASALNRTASSHLTRKVGHYRPIADYNLPIPVLPCYARLDQTHTQWRSGAVWQRILGQNLRTDSDSKMLGSVHL